METVELETFECGPLPERAVRMRTTYSLISTGTEETVLHGAFDQNTHWAAWVSYPFYPGYSAVGVVEEIGSDVGDIAVGDRVVARVGHASENVVEAYKCTPVPANVPSKDASWFGLAKIALMGARAAEYRLGDSVAVIGAGPIGQLTVRWAAAAGARSVVVVDTVEQRLAAATTGGATAVVAAPVNEAAEKVVAACGGRPRIVVDSTGNETVLTSALGLVADRGRVVLLGDTGSPTSQRLTSDVITRGLTIVGAHDGHSRTGEDWDGDRSLHELFFYLAATGRFALDGLITHVFPPEECADAYELAARRRGETMGIVFDWSEV